MKKKIFIVAFVSIFAFLTSNNNVHALGSPIQSTKTAGTQSIIINEKTFTGTLYSEMSYYDAGTLKTVTVNRLLVNSDTLKSMINAFVEGNNKYSVNIQGSNVYIDYLCDDSDGTKITAAINFKPGSLNTSYYRERKKPASGFNIAEKETQKLSSSSPNYKEKNITVMKGGSGVDLFFVNGGFSVRGLADALGAATDWRDGRTKLNYPYLLTELPQYCDWSK